MKLAFNITTAMVILFLIGPLLLIVGASFTTTRYITFPPVGFTLEWYEKLTGYPDLLNAFYVSTVVALLTALFATVLGTLSAVALHRSTVLGRELLRAFVTSPLVLPTVVTGVALFSFFQEIEFDAPWSWLVIGHTLITVPYAVRNVGAALAALDQSQVEAAQGLGATWPRVLWSVIFPAAGPAIAVSAILIFVVSFDQVTVSIFLSTPDTVPLPVRLYNYLEWGLDPMIAAISTLLILFAYLLVATLERLLGLHKLFGKGAAT